MLVILHQIVNGQSHQMAIKIEDIQWCQMGRFGTEVYCTQMGVIEVVETVDEIVALINATLKDQK